VATRPDFFTFFFSFCDLRNFAAGQADGQDMGANPGHGMKLAAIINIKSSLKLRVRAGKTAQDRNPDPGVIQTARHRRKGDRYDCCQNYHECTCG
jgi:hypothetical protein